MANSKIMSLFIIPITRFPFIAYLPTLPWAIPFPIPCFKFILLIQTQIRGGGRGSHHDPALERARLAEALALAVAMHCPNGVVAVDSGFRSRPGGTEMTMARHWRGRGQQSRRWSRRVAPLVGGQAASVAVVAGGAGGGRRSVHACVAKCGRACLAGAHARCLVQRVKWAIVNKILSTWADHGPS
jgi:hypothetical protein